MAPTDKAIAKELADVVRRVYYGPKRDQLSVNYTRQIVEEKLELEDGFLKEGDWKVKSKRIILDTVKELQSAEAQPSQEAAPTPKKMAKPAPKRDTKRPKKAPSPSDAESDAHDASDVEDTPQRPVKKRKVAKVQRAKKKVIFDDEEDVWDASEGNSDEEPPKPAAKSRSNQPAESDSELSDVPEQSSESKPASEKGDTPKPAAEDDESELSDVIDEPLKRKPKAKFKAKASPQPKASSNSKPADDDTSSELSSVIDEPPPPKRKRKSTKDTTTTSRSTSARGTKFTTTTADSPVETQIKLLQSQLSKCGVRKVWAFEFKKHGADTPKAKIKHLKQMLVDVGMTGRFSEAKAREIKEMRELQADLQDVMQGEKSWGVGGGGRGVRRRAAAASSLRGKGLREEGSGDEDEEGDGEEKNGDAGSEEDDVGGKTAVMGKGPARRRPDLAFLDDESESE